ncbi:MAG TPA: CDP-alcohol phosphatidyltransferase family protein [Verrucomicrobiota bacterium]|nr:CDP-alcohol phosphatidyltransferase family protein [Verrucomicrobiota bacterium]
MTIPNYISMLRLMLVPVFVISLLDYADTGTELSWWTAVAAFLVAAVSDGVDGYIARRFRQRSELGAFLDPLADKILLVSGLVVLSFSSKHLPQLPIWMIGMVFGRDLFLLLGFFVITHWCGKMKIQPHVISKCATVLQMIVVAWGVLGRKDQFGLETDWLFWWCLVATLCTGATFFVYFPAGMKQLKAVPASGPSEDQSRRLVRLDLEIDPSTRMRTQTPRADENEPS